MKRVRLNISAIFMLLTVSFLFVSFSAAGRDITVKELVEEAKTGIRTISTTEANSMFGKSGVVFLDVREPDEFKTGHIPGAVNIPRGLLESRIEDQVSDKNSTIVVYCRSGVRSALASATLVKMGYKGVLNMDGGWKAWQEAGYPAE
jgi:rhodanese-related sulfurtransferase